ncbi:MAG: hypothetical protein ACREJ4_08140 [Candidatus Methylomirabilaceae bacterium]
MAGARVFFLADDGHELASGSTDACGRAAFPHGQVKHARYVFVEVDGYFIGGMRSDPAMREYYILLTVAAVP